MDEKALEAAVRAMAEVDANHQVYHQRPYAEWARAAVQAYLAALPNPEGVRAALENLARSWKFEDEPETAQPYRQLMDAADALAKLQAERDKLAGGIANAAAKAGIYNEEAPLSDPQLLILVELLALAATQSQAEEECLQQDLATAKGIAKAESAAASQSYEAQKAAEAEAARLRAILTAVHDGESFEIGGRTYDPAFWRQGVSAALQQKESSE